MVHWTGDRDHIGKGENWGAAIFPLPMALLILEWQLWTRFHYKTPVSQWAHSISCWASWPLAHFPSAEDEFAFFLCVNTALLHARDIRAPTSSDLHCPQCSDRAIIRCMYVSPPKPKCQNWIRIMMMIMTTTMVSVIVVMVVLRFGVQFLSSSDLSWSTFIMQLKLKVYMYISMT